MAKAKAKFSSERLDPPLTAKERKILRQVQSAISGVVAAFQFAEDPGVRSLASEVSIVYSESTTRLVQAYRDGKAE